MNIGDTYIIRIKIDDRIFTYTGKLISEDIKFISFIDKYGKTWTYNKDNLISMEELK